MDRLRAAQAVDAALFCTSKDLGALLLAEAEAFSDFKLELCKVPSAAESLLVVASSDSLMVTSFSDAYPLVFFPVRSRHGAEELLDAELGSVFSIAGVPL